jgi:hypothetical protein
MNHNIVAYFWLKDMSPHLCYLPYSFTGAGGSQKPAAHNKDKLVVNPATGNLAQKSVIAQQARDAKKLKQGWLRRNVLRLLRRPSLIAL